MGGLSVFRIDSMKTKDGLDRWIAQHQWPEETNVVDTNATINEYFGALMSSSVIFGNIRPRMIGN